MGTNPKPTAQQMQREVYYATAINKMAAAANVGLTEATVAIYLERLLQLNQNEMDEATRRTIDEWTEPSKMPTLAFILDRTGNSPKLLAEQAWAFAEPFIEKNWHPDMGWQPGAQAKMTPAMLYAIRQSGGLNRVWGEASPFVRKDFIAAFERFTQENGQQDRLLPAAAPKELQGSNEKVLDGKV